MKSSRYLTLILILIIILINALFYLFYTFLIYVHVFVPHRVSSNNSIKCRLLSMSGPRLPCGVISVKMLAFLNLISCEYGAVANHRQRMHSALHGS